MERRKGRGKHEVCGGKRNEIRLDVGCRGHEIGMHQQVTVLILKTSSRKRASQWGQTAGEGSREGRSVL